MILYLCEFTEMEKADLEESTSASTSDILLVCKKSLIVISSIN